MPTGGARIDVAIRRMTGVGISPLGTCLPSFVSFYQSVLKIIIGNQLRFITKWPPGGAVVVERVRKLAVVGVPIHRSFLRSFVEFCQTALKL